MWVKQRLWSEDFIKWTRTADLKKKKHILFAPVLETDFLKEPHGGLLVLASESSELEQARFILCSKTLI